MPDLPAVTVTQEQYDLLMQTFESESGGEGQPATPEEACAIYYKRLARNRVSSLEAESIYVQYEADRDAAIGQAMSDLSAVWPPE